MSDVDNIKVFLTGGAANDDPNASLGGAVSSHEVLAQSASGLSNITGIAFGNGIRGNTVGAGTLAYTNATQTITWAQSGGAAGEAVDISADGTYYLKDADGIATLEITVTAASLPGTDQSDTITIANIANEKWDDISGVEGFNGDTEYRWFALKNTHATKTYLLKLWIHSQPSGNDTLQIGLYESGGTPTKNTEASTLADENTAPSGTEVTFSAPADIASGLSITLAPGDYICYAERRDIVAGEYAEVTADVSALAWGVIEA